MPRTLRFLARELREPTDWTRRSRATALLLLAVGITAGVALVLSTKRRRGRELRRGDDRAARLRNPATARSRQLVARLPVLTPADGDAARPLPPLPAHIDRTLDESVVLETRVLEAFRHDMVLAERAIDIGALETGVIELAGWVDSPNEVALAVTIARGIPGVTRVVDHLAVRGRTPPRSHATGNYAAVTVDDLERERADRLRAD